jgi:hypothetical protein
VRCADDGRLTSAYHSPSLPSQACASTQADDGTRTRYLELGKLALYQVSYVREGVSFYAARAPARSRSICSA